MEATAEMPFMASFGRITTEGTENHREKKKLNPKGDAKTARTTRTPSHLRRNPANPLIL